MTSVKAPRKSIPLARSSRSCSAYGNTRTLLFRFPSAKGTVLARQTTKTLVLARKTTKTLVLARKTTKRRFLSWYFVDFQETRQPEARCRVGGSETRGLSKTKLLGQDPWWGRWSDRDILSFPSNFGGLDGQFSNSPHKPQATNPNN